MTAPAVTQTVARGRLLDELGELIERRRLAEGDWRHYRDSYEDYDLPLRDQEAEIERLDDEIDEAAAQLVTP